MKYLDANCLPNHNYFLYKQPFLGSYKKMRFRVSGEFLEDGQKNYLAITYPDEVCFEKTPNENKVEQRFEFSDAGRIEAMCWLDAQYEERYR